MKPYGIETINRSIRNKFDTKICRGGWVREACFLKGEGGSEYIYLYVQGDR